MQTMDAMRPRQRHPLENRVPPPLVMLLTGAAMTAVAWLTPAVNSGGPLRWTIGGLGLAMGASVVVIGARTFWRNRTTIDPVDIERASTLVTGGIFSLSRNPMYVGFTTMLVCWGICLGAPWSLLGPVGFLFFIKRFQVIPEERAMHAKFGQAYDDYRAKVRRWV